MSNQIKLLKRARKRIEAGKIQFVCLALDKRSLTAYTIISHTIRKLLCGYVCLEDWLDKTYPRKYNTCNFDMMRMTRIAWIDWMINEIETNGDFNIYGEN